MRRYRHTNVISRLNIPRVQQKYNRREVVDKRVATLSRMVKEFHKWSNREQLPKVHIKGFNIYDI